MLAETKLYPFQEEKQRLEDRLEYLRQLPADPTDYIHQLIWWRELVSDAGIVWKYKDVPSIRVVKGKSVWYTCELLEVFIKQYGMSANQAIDFIKDIDLGGSMEMTKQRHSHWFKELLESTDKINAEYIPGLTRKELDDLGFNANGKLSFDEYRVEFETAKIEGTENFEIRMIDPDYFTVGEPITDAYRFKELLKWLIPSLKTD
jgi:hypothetical protein